VPIMLGNADATPDSIDGRHMHPLIVQGVHANSIGYLVPPEKASIWRGPMVSRALQQLYQETVWPKLDFLIIDMPPGTGDIQLTLSQQIPVDGAVIVTTPQDLALADAIKGIALFERVEIPVLGLVENMSYHQCEQCGHKSYLFSKDGGVHLSEKYQVPLLGRLPLDMQIREHADGGLPIVPQQPDCDASRTYLEVATQIQQVFVQT
ncbi:MAG: Mrp/NBP35 family ATP-binding protein, partial [Cyanobacteria bacterium P01_F01_bin.86]